MTYARVSPARGAGTTCVHAGGGPDEGTGALVYPLVQSTAYAWTDLDHPPGTSYARTGHPTGRRLEARLAALEGGGDAIVFASGIAALDALVRILPEGGRVVAGRHLYGGTTRLLQRLHASRLRIDSVDSTDPEALAASLESPADLVLVESPSNPTLLITDLRAAADAAHAAGAWFAVDNTFLTPLYQRPLALGADVVVESTTKYLDGHNATLGGALVVAEEHAGPGEAPEGTLAARFRWVRKVSGAGLAPFEAWLTLHGLKTLHLRTRQQWASARSLADRLRAREEVRRVYHPGLEDHPGHAVHRRQATGDGGIVTIDLGSRAAARAFVASLRLFTLAENVGATESLATHPATMTHADLSADQRRADGIADGLVRLSIGVEDEEDLWEDIDSALQQVRPAVEEEPVEGGRR